MAGPRRCEARRGGPSGREPAVDGPERGRELAWTGLEGQGRAGVPPPGGPVL
ncbi:hypothetical protein SSAG_06491 [Streptomyces sp. Mg1]|nr:hypothetical protein SSAG_06491 [Streptomyces sp. Mg1]